jgi:hypothetical protein
MQKPNLEAEFSRVGRGVMESAANIVTAIFEREFSEAMANAIAEVQEMLGVPPPKHATRKVRTEAKSGWPADPEARSAEMKRRQAVARANKANAEGLHPRDEGHPDHDKWRAKLTKARKRQWAQKSPAERHAWQERMAAARRKQKRESARLEQVA